MASRYTVGIEGLSESIKLLSRVDKELRHEAGVVIRTGAIKIKTEAQARLATTPGVSRKSYPVSKTAVFHRATATKGAVGINTGRYATIGPAEFGWSHQFVPYRNGKGRFMRQGQMRRRTFPIWRGNQHGFKFPKYGERRALLAGPGWIVQPILRKRTGMILQEIDEGMARVFDQSARRAGVPR